jgi:hypothetical protein
LQCRDSSSALPNEFALVILQAQLLYALEPYAPSPVAETFAGKVGQSLHQIRQHWIRQIENVDIEMKRVSALKLLPREMMGPQDERPGTLGKTTRPVPSATRFEDPSIGTFRIVSHSAALRRAGRPAEHAPQRSSERIGCGSGRELNRIKRLKVKPETEKLELHVSSSIGLDVAEDRGVARVCFLYNVYAF